MSKIENELSTISDYIRWTISQLRIHNCFQGHGSSNAMDDACHLVFSALHLNPEDDLDMLLDSTLTTEERINLLSLIDKRVNQKIPTAYLTKTSWFAGLQLFVDERVIVPRSPIAELIKNRFQPWLDVDTTPERILDLCTGSGCLALACAYVFPETDIDAVDISKDAIDVANINIKNHGLDDQVKAIQSDLFSALGDKKYSIIICNPPYVSETEYQELPKEYMREPENALKGGDVDGLAIVSNILRHAREHLTDDGFLIMEVGYSDEALEERYPDVPFMWIDFENGGDGVFVFTAEQLDLLQHLFSEHMH